VRRPSGQGQNLEGRGQAPALAEPLGVDLAGASTAVPDTSCAGLMNVVIPPQNSVALPGATAWAALFLTPKIVLNSLVPYSPGDRARYPLVLGPTQSQVTALRVQGASFVIQLANGTTVEGSLDETGEAEVPITAAPTQVQFGPDERDWAADDQEPNPDYRQFASSDEADAFVDARFQET